MYFLIPFLGLLIADQAVKHLIRTTMVQGQSIPIIENIFQKLINMSLTFGQKNCII